MNTTRETGGGTAAASRHPLDWTARLVVTTGPTTGTYMLSLDGVAFGLVTPDENACRRGRAWLLRHLPELARILAEPVPEARRLPPLRVAPPALSREARPDPEGAAQARRIIERLMSGG